MSFLITITQDTNKSKQLLKRVFVTLSVVWLFGFSYWFITEQRQPHKFPIVTELYKIDILKGKEWPDIDNNPADVDLLYFTRYITRNPDRLVKHPIDKASDYYEFGPKQYVSISVIESETSTKLIMKAAWEQRGRYIRQETIEYVIQWAVYGSLLFLGWAVGLMGLVGAYLLAIWILGVPSKETPIS